MLVQPCPVTSASQEMLPLAKMLCLPHFILYSWAAWKGSTFWAREFESVPIEATSPSLCHHKGASQDPDPKAAAVRETFLLGDIPTGIHSYQPQWLLQQATPQRRAARHTIILARFAADFVKLKAKGLKGIMEKTNFFLITIFKTSEVTYIGRVEIKSNNAFSVDSLPLFVKARTSKEECELPHIAHEGQPLCRAVTQHRQGLFPPQ